MARAAWGVLALGLACAAWWLLQTDEPEMPSLSDPQPEREGALSLGARSDVTPDEAAAPVPDPFAEVDDLQALLAPLNEWRTSKPAARRVAALVGSDRERIRALLRLMHPDTGSRALGGHTVQQALGPMLRAIGDPALDVLIEELEDGHAHYRTWIDALIGGFRADGARAVPALLRQLERVPEDPPLGEAASVINALGAIGAASGEILPELYAWLEEGVTEVVEIAAARAAVRIGGPTDGTWTMLKALLREENWSQQRRAALQALAELGPKARPMIPILMQYVAEGVIDEHSVLHTIQHIGTADAELMAWLETKFQKATSLERAYGQYARTLAKLGDEGETRAYALAAEGGAMHRAHLPLLYLGDKDVPWGRLLEAMAPAFAAHEARIRRWAYQNVSVHDAKPREEVHRLALRAIDDPDGEVRRQGIWLVINQQAPASELLYALLRRVQDPKETLENALDAAAELGNHEAMRNDRLFEAYRGLLARPSETAQQRVRVLSLFGLFADTRTDDVLRLWAQGVAAGEITWDGYVYTLVKLPADALQAYPEALAALRAYEKRRR